MSMRLEMTMSPVLYTGIFLTDESRANLMEWWQEEIGPLLPNEFAHHCTLAFRPTPEVALAAPLGDVVKLVVVGYAADDKGQAVAVASPIRSNNKVAHVTVSTADGVPPFYSNELLSEQLKPCSHLELYGVVAAQGRDKRFTQKSPAD